jgi:NAD(P)-dependent dehydrogenase (short-subunit alcohol dehydrogenase family)
MSNLFNIKGKTILVTGASSGIGKEIAIQCANEGANVIITGRDNNRLLETLNQISLGNSVICDLNNEEEITQLVQSLPELDGVVFCAGIVEFIPVRLINLKKINNIFTTNFNSQAILTQQLLKFKKIKPNSSLVYISSISSKVGVVGTALYASTKAALNAFVRVTASELSNQKIRVNSVCPGTVITPMGEKAINMSEGIENYYPLGLGKPIDVAGPSIFLLSDASKWITGTELVLDGGLTLT